MKAALTLAALAAALVAQPGQAAPVANTHWHAMAGTMFPALEAVARARLPEDVRAMLAARHARIDACREDAHCLMDAARWQEAEIALIADKALIDAASHYKAPDDGAKGDIRRQLVGINAIIAVYGQGQPARYVAIDGPVTGKGTGQEALTNLRFAVELAHGGMQDPVTALDPSIAVAIALLDANDRDEPAAFEPLDAKYNAEALARAKTTPWARYRYSAIIVPGVGPEEVGVPISPRSKLNARMAAQRFADGLAPFIIVSGANVHPRGTRFVEAVQLRKALIEEFNVPAAVIVIDPYARHTTTNLRNVTRRLVAMGAPLDKDTLIVTNTEQSAMIENPDFAARNRKELGYLPGTVGKRLSPYDLVFRPSISSLRVDPLDPLDP
ncbi:ElyC/SanA/YdcF family protein [Novosphingobium rosa]|uniref:ElyC/SanA/YdcF family protein n=1 Tax=Novosphingobium rosa TaxID=76978 RepID=UPI000A0214C6|nr:ElyC/SanA/YdcF family protein [Novosphingobium rosa]